MNCERARQSLWLEASGELDAPEREALAAHLAACAPCRNERAETEALVKAVRQALPAGEPAPAVRARIRAAGRERLESRRLVLFPSPVAPLLAVAAVLALCLGGWFLVSSNRPAADPLGDLRTLMTALSRTDAGRPAEVADGTAAEKELHALAQQLLQMEGFSATEEAAPEPTEENGELQPTALRWHSTFELPARRCG